MLFIAQCQDGLDGGTGETRFDAKIFSNTDIDSDFSGSSVIIVMDKATGGVNKRHEKSFFGGIEIESIRDLTELTGDIY